jgi:mutator protein MutT
VSAGEIRRGCKITMIQRFGKRTMTDPQKMHVRVIAALIERAGKLLVCQRPAHKLHGGLWEFPGGKLEPGESLADAARRELSEELSLNVVKVGDVKYTSQDAASGLQIEFVEVETEGNIYLHEHQALAWVTKDELQRVQLAPSDRRCADYLCGLTRG